MPETYSGRLECDGEGNLLASGGDDHGKPVRYENGTFVFVQPGEPSHNEMHETNVVEMKSTAQAEADGDLDFDANPHHNEVQSDDAHYDGVKKDADAVAAKITGHTDAYKGDS